MFSDCTPVCRVDLHRCKCSGTRLLSAGLAQQHRATRQAVDPKHCNSAQVLGTAHLYAEWIFTGVNAVAQGCCQLVWHSSIEEQDRQLTQNTAAVHWCSVTAHLYAEWIFIGVNAVMFSDCTPVCRVDLHRCKCCGTRLLSPGLAQQHRATRQAVDPKHCSKALVFGDCTPVCRVELHRCKCSGTRLLSAGLAQQHRKTRQAVNPKHCSSALVFGDCTPVCRVDLYR